MIKELKINKFLSLNTHIHLSKLNIVRSNDYSGMLLMKLLYALQWHRSIPHEEDPINAFTQKLERLFEVEPIEYDLTCNGWPVSNRQNSLMKANVPKPAYLDTYTLDQIKLWKEYGVEELTVDTLNMFEGRNIGMDMSDADSRDRKARREITTLLGGDTANRFIQDGDKYTPVSWLSIEDRILINLETLMVKGALWGDGLLLWNNPSHKNIKGLAKLIDIHTKLNQVVCLTNNQELIDELIRINEFGYSVIDLNSNEGVLDQLLYFS